MRFSWKALLLAPLVVPCSLGALLVVSSPDNPVKNPSFGYLDTFIFMSALGSVVSYGATIFLLLPSLYVLSRITQLTLTRVVLLGAILGVILFIPLTWINWHASGPNSGPPETRFLTYLWRDAHDPNAWVAFPGGGLVTALAYGLLSYPRKQC